MKMLFKVRNRVDFHNGSSIVMKPHAEDGKEVMGGICITVRPDEANLFVEGKVYAVEFSLEESK